MKLTVHQYRKKLEQVFGFADPEMVKRYAEARAKHKADNFNPLTDDPNCKTCKKQKKGTGV